jgi:uncharacterized protein (DUF433 family)
MSTLITETIPITKDNDGILRVGDTRVTLETVVSAFKEGETAEDIVSAYPSLSLADVYTVIGYYLHRQTEIEEYIREQAVRSAEVRIENEKRFAQKGIRERLLARKK